MENEVVKLFVGVCQITLLFRHARSLKDKRNTMKSLTQKLKNRGFSVTQCAFAELPKQGALGFTFAGNSKGMVDQALDDGLRLFVGDFEISSKRKDVFDYSEDEYTDFEAKLEDDWGVPR